MSESTYSQTAVVRDEIGLHVRPAEMLARAAKRFEAKVELVYEEQAVDAKSIMHILTLGARHGAEVEVRAAGQDATEAVAAIVELFDRNFDADQTETPTPGSASQTGTLGQQA